MKKKERKANSVGKIILKIQQVTVDSFDFLNAKRFSLISSFSRIILVYCFTPGCAVFMTFTIYLLKVDSSVCACR